MSDAPVARLAIRWVVVVAAGALAALATGYVLANPVLAIASGLAAGSAIGACLYPRAGLWLFFLWLPAGDLLKRLLFAAPGGNASQLQYFLALGLPDVVLLGAIAGVTLEIVRRWPLRLKVDLPDVLVGAYLAWTVASLANPSFPLNVRLVGLKSSGYYIVLYFLVRAYGALDVGWLSGVRKVVLGVSAIAAVYAMYQAYFGFQPYELAWLKSGLTQLGGGDEGLGPTIALYGIVRPFSFFASHEQLAWYLVFAVLITLGSPKRLWLDWPLLALFLAAIARTLSRSAWLMLAASLGLMILLALASSRRRDAIRAALAGLVFVAAVVGFALGPAAEEQKAEGGAFARRATTVGTYEWRVFSFSEFINDPEWHTPFGNGVGSMWTAWRLGAPGTTNPPSLEEKVPGTRILSHVGIIDIAYEVGLLGLALYLALVVVVLGRGIGRALKTRRGGDLAGADIAYVGGATLANAIVTTVMMFRPIAAPYWLMMGSIVSATDRTGPERAASPPGDPITGSHTGSGAGGEE